MASFNPSALAIERRKISVGSDIKKTMIKLTVTANDYFWVLHFGVHFGPFRFISVPILVHTVHFGPFRSISVNNSNYYFWSKISTTSYLPGQKTGALSFVNSYGHITYSMKFQVIPRNIVLACHGNIFMLLKKVTFSNMERS